MSVRIILHCDHILGSSAYVHISGCRRSLGEQPRYNRRMYINGEGGLLVSFHIQVVRAHDDDLSCERNALYVMYGWSGVQDRPGSGEFLLASCAVLK